MPTLLENSLLSEKCFKLTPPKIININDNLQSESSDCLEKLVQLCYVKNNNFKDHFNRHLNFAKSQKDYQLQFGDSTISLEQALKFIYLQLSRLEVSSSLYETIILALTNDIEFCTAGFINRVSAILDSLQQPQSFDELLYQSRLDLIKNLAFTLAGTQDQEIHAVNQVMKVAASQGLGVQVNFRDPYLSGLIFNEIKTALQEEFKVKFTPFNLPFLLTEQLHGLLTTLGYEGFNQEEHGYLYGAIEIFNTNIKKFLVEELIEDSVSFFFIIDEDSFVIRDINWQLIRTLFYKTLNEEDYFTTKISENEISSLLDCALYSHLFHKNQLLGTENRWISPQLDENFYRELLKIKADIPDFWMLLRSHPELIKKIPLFLDDIKKTLPNTDTVAKKIGLLFTLDLNDTINIDKETWQTIFFKRDNAGCNVLMSLAHKNPEGFQAFLEFLIKHPAWINTGTLKTIFFKRDNAGWNVLLLLACYNAKGFQAFLEFLTVHLNWTDKKTLKMLQAMLLQKNNEDWNVLLLLACYNAKGLQAFLEFLVEHPNWIDKETLQMIFFKRDNMGWNVLLLLARYNPEGFKVLLEFLIKHPAWINEKTLKMMLLQKNNEGWNVLMSLAHKNPEGFQAFLEFLVEHPNWIDKKTLKMMLLQKNNLGWHVLMLLANYNLEGLQVFLEFLVKHPNWIDKKTLQAMLLQENNQGSDVLQWLAYYNPEGLQSLKVLFEFLIEHPEWDSKKTSQRILSINKVELKLFILEKLLGNYLEVLDKRKENTIIYHAARFFKYNAYSTQEKKTAAQALKNSLKERDSNNLLNLDYPALKSGFLHGLFRWYESIIKLQDCSIEQKEPAQRSP